MRTRSNSEVFQRVWELYAAGRGPEILEHLDPEVQWLPALVDPGSYHGREGVRKYYERMMVGPNSVVADMGSEPVVEGRKLYQGDTSVSYGAMNDWFKLRDGTEATLVSGDGFHPSTAGHLAVGLAFATTLRRARAG